MPDIDIDVKRPDWDDVWLEVARIAGKRSRCVRGAIGCVLVSPTNEVVAVSYVGPPPGFLDANIDDSDCRSWCPRSSAVTLDPGYRDCVSSHAEMNAIARADFTRIRGGTAYVNGATCWMCAKGLAASGVARVVMETRIGEMHRNPAATETLLVSCGIQVENRRMDS